MSGENRDAACRRYSYRVVTCNGHGVHSNLIADVREARRLAKRLAVKERDHRVKLGPYEVERVEHVNLGHDWPRRYSMRDRRWWCRCEVCKWARRFRDLSEHVLEATNHV